MLRNEASSDPDLLAAALKGLRDYQEAPRRAPLPLAPALAEARGATLRDYGGEGRPVIFVPSLINPPTVLDLNAERSLLRWLAARGHRVLLIDWGTDAAARRDLSVAGHVEQIVLPFMRELGAPPALVGYCLGGTMATAAACAGETAGLALIAAPWHFGGYPQAARDMTGALWRGSEAIVERLGFLPMEVLQSAFWSLDPARTIAKFAGFGRLPADDPKREIFIALEDWANDGPPLPAATARELFEDFFGKDRPGQGNWQVTGHLLDPARLTCPVLNLVSTTDRIVPEPSAAKVGERLRFSQGHVGLVVGSGALDGLGHTLDTWLRQVGTQPSAQT